MQLPNLRKHIAAKIISLRNGRDVKVHAEVCNLTYNHMYKMEAGNQGYDAESIAAICKANNITLSQFYEGMPLD